MDIEVVGRHVLLFDDDSTAAFVNSGDALVEWNSLQIDRYDVRHLLSGPPPPRRRQNLQETQSTASPPSGSSIESELDYERYLDLPSPSDEQVDKGSKPVDGGVYNAVAFSYGNTENSSDQKNADAGFGDTGFRPPFPVPESLLQCLPPTEKLHQIIARTAEFVSKHGGQSEIVLRVKQGDNPTFGFLMPDHHLHAYFRFLVDHQELLQSDVDGKTHDEKKSGADQNQTEGVRGGALSLLGSVYGSAEDDDGAAEDDPPKARVSEEASDDVSALASHNSEKTMSSANVNGKDSTTSSKQKVLALKRNPPISASKAGTTGNTRKDSDTLGSFGASVNKSQASALPTTSKVEYPVLEPPSDLKRVVDKIVEFILKNGKQFEAVLVEQDSKHGRFPFLLPSNQYHSYYKRVLQQVQESKLSGKNSFSEDVPVGHVSEKKTSRSKSENDTLSLESAGCDIPYDSDKKGKFKMVLGKSKKDGPDPPPKATQQQFGVSIDAASAAAILQAASRGMKNPSLGILSSTSLKGNNDTSSQPESVVQKSDQNGGHGVSVPIAKAIAKSAALEAASEADSSEAHLTKEQKLKAERLKRAKLFVSMLKTEAIEQKPESSRGVSMEPQESRSSVFGPEVGNLAVKEREGSSVPLDVDTSDKNEKSGNKCSDDELNQSRPRRKYRSRSMRVEEEEEEEEEDGHEKDHTHSTKKRKSHHSSREDEDEEERNHKHSKKKHRSRRSSHNKEEEEDEEEQDHKHSRKKHRSSHSSSDDEEDDEKERDRRDTRKKHRSNHSSYKEEQEDEEEEEERDRKHSRSKHRSSREDEEDDEEERDRKYSRKKHRSYRSSNEELEEEDEDEEERVKKNSKSTRRSHSSSHHSRDKRKHRKRRFSKERESSRHSHKHDKSSDDEHDHRRRSDKSRKRDPSEREELEEGEISSKTSDQSRGSLGDGGASREPSHDLPNLSLDGRASSQPSEVTEVSDDLRAKIRAMLMATL